MVHWLAIGGTLGYRAFTASTAHTDTVDYVTCLNKNTMSVMAETTTTHVQVLLDSALTLLGLVSQPTGLVRSGGSRSTVEV